MPPRISHLLWALPLIAATAAAGPPRADLVTFQGHTMGEVPYTVRVILDDDVDRDALRQQVDAVLERINALMSTYRPDSELSQFNASRQTGWFPVSAETARVVHRSLEIAALSGGAFDPTVGRLVRLWNFGPGPRSGQVPGDRAVREALQWVGYRYVQVRLDPPALRKEVPEVELDLSAIAKGYAVDAVSQMLAEQGWQRFMVEVGGEVRTAGTKFGGVPWRIAIERPLDQGRDVDKVLQLTDASLATSGDYRNFFEQDGVRYSHTIDPQTGRPVTHSLASASVLADDCMTADALATALMVLGPQRGLQFADEQGLAVLLIERTPAGFRESISRAGQEQFAFLALDDVGLGTHAADQPARPAQPVWLTVGLTVGVFSLALLGLAVGVLLSQRPLRGSCGGIPGEQGGACHFCSSPQEQCEEFRQKVQQQARQQPDTAGES